MHIVNQKPCKYLGDQYLADYSLWGAGQVAGDNVVLEPLKEEESGLWLADSRQQTFRVPQAAVVRRVEADYGQRVDPDRISNPHSEHAEDIWQLLDVELSPDFDYLGKKEPRT